MFFKNPLRLIAICSVLPALVQLYNYGLGPLRGDQRLNWWVDMSHSLKLIILAIFAIAIVTLSPCLGGISINLSEIFAALKGLGGGARIDSGSSIQILLMLRIPRVMLAFFVGAALSVSGLILQTTFRTALATPFTLGTSAGAAFGASMMLVIGGVSATASLLGAVLGGALVGILVITVIGLHRRVKTSDVLLIGLTLSFFFSSLTMLLQYLARPSEMMAINRWMSGQLTVPGWWGLAAFSSTVLIVSLGLTLISRILDMLSLGVEFLSTHGVSIRTVLLCVVVSVAILSGVTVAMAGPIAFAGILEPYLARKLFGSKHRHLIPGAVLIGGSIMVIADLIARTALFPIELPVSLLLGIIGLPFFIWIIVSERCEI